MDREDLRSEIFKHIPLFGLWPSESADQFVELVEEDYDDDSGIESAILLAIETGLDPEEDLTEDVIMPFFIKFYNFSSFESCIQLTSHKTKTVETYYYRNFSINVWNTAHLRYVTGERYGKILSADTLDVIRERLSITELYSFAEMDEKVFGILKGLLIDDEKVNE